MTDSREPNAGEILPELCDLCGAAITDQSEVYTVVRDSSAIHAHDPKLDGKRWLTACSRDHMAALVDQYKQRPFVDAELWAGKIDRAVEAHGGKISPEVLAEETRLTHSQIELGVLWQNLGALRWHQRFGKGDGPTSAE
ncbi:hypothetical protein WKI65_43495 [Streptomyces sp. MS1.AVA.3]|uniref:hypothetical protein n=1 Tax=Streptomyces decoyicus TaxID=249567 RepID=UPI0030BF10AA